jgi:hypothetical protein
VEQFCYYCKNRKAVDGPKIDKDGIGWLPNCLIDLCEWRASLKAERQRKAREQFDAR